MDMKEKLQEIMDKNPFVHLGDALYTILYQGIIRMEISADAVLSETALARDLELSRTPVRNALMRLQDDGRYRWLVTLKNCLDRMFRNQFWF